MSDAILTARRLVKTYPSGDGRIEVLRGINLSIAPGDSISVRGESGSGKSTLLHLLSGLDVPDAGEMHWEGAREITSARRAAFLGMVFQSFYLIPELDARENLLMAARIAGRVGDAERKRAEELLARVGLAERGHHVPAHLSGGERQRVAIARALMNRPRLVLADEPTGNLDERTGDSVIELLLSLCADTKTALVLVTHNPAYAARTAREVLLHLGKLETKRG